MVNLTDQNEMVRHQASRTNKVELLRLLLLVVVGVGVALGTRSVAAQNSEGFAQPSGAVTITVTAGNFQTTLGPEQTVLVPSTSNDITFTIQYASAVNQPTVGVQLIQPGGIAPWHIVPSGRMPRANSYIFRVRGTNTTGTYFRAEVTRGTGNPVLRFGVQVNNPNARPNRPALSANWMDAVALVNAYYNAVNRAEYQRAYSYWDRPGAPYAAPANYTAFVRGYSHTSRVNVMLGTAMGDAGAGNVYVAVPTVLAATLENGQQQRFYGCYLLHRINVEQGNTIPPYPFFIRSARIMTAPANANPATLLAQANAFVQSGKCTQ